MNLSPLNLVDYKIKSFSFKSVDGLEENELNINAAKISCTQTLRVNKDNIASQKVMLNNGAYIAGEDEAHLFMRIPK